MERSGRQMGLGVLAALVLIGVAAHAGCTGKAPKPNCSGDRDDGGFGVVFQFPNHPAVHVPPGQSTTVTTGGTTYVLHSDHVTVSVPPKPENTDWVIGFYVDNSLPFGHAFIKIRKYTDPPTSSMWREGYGFYPGSYLASVTPGKGSIERKDRTAAWDRKLCFRITNEQYHEIRKRISDWDRDGTYFLFTCNCVTFVYDIADVIDVDLRSRHLEKMAEIDAHDPEGLAPNMAMAIVHRPGNLYAELGEWSQHVDNTNEDRTMEVREREDQIIDARK